MTTVHYTNDRRYVGNRPVADVVLIGPAGTRSTTWLCLVDTGADYLQLPDAEAAAVGLSLAAGVSETIDLSDGSQITLTKVSNVRVEIEGRTVTVDVLFGPAAVMPPLGRQALLAAFEAGFNAVEWLRM